MTFKYRFVIATCARWETRYAVEWLNYHRALGFEHVYMYCNDDDPRPLYQAVLPFTQGPAPFVTFRHHAAQGEQRRMLLHFLEHDRHEAEWISFLDLDEFLRLPRGQSIAEFIAPFAPVADSVMFNWVFFGPNGHATPPDAPVLSAFTRRSAELHPFTKHVSRSFLFDDPRLRHQGEDASFIHQLGGYTDRDIRAVNVLGEDMRDYYTGFPAASAAFVRHPPRQAAIFAKAVVQHYAFRSEQAFNERVARGLKGNFSGQQLWGDLAAGEGLNGFINEINAVEDRSLADFWPNLLAQAWQGSTQAGGTVLDLGAIATIREIRLHHTAPAQSLSVSIDGASWVELAETDAPFTWNGPGAAWARYVKVSGPADPAQIEVLA
jgi:hypothetical protein